MFEVYKLQSIYRIIYKMVILKHAVYEKSLIFMRKRSTELRPNRSKAGLRKGRAKGLRCWGSH